MIGFCPFCEKETKLTRIQHIENFRIIGESIPVEVDYFVCDECGKEFDNPRSIIDPLEIAYREYRNRKGMVQPDEIKKFRDKYHFSQHELSDLLGFGAATLSRYENGALQDRPHDTLLHLLMEPRNLLRLIGEKPNIFNKSKWEKLNNYLRDEISASEMNELLGISNNEDLSLENGLTKFDINKLVNVIKVFTFQTRVYKTKLNKLLFYADFKHFKEYGTSITGLSYAHLPLGPVPDQYELFYEWSIKHDSSLIKKEGEYNDSIVVQFLSRTEPDSNILSISEIEILGFVKNYFSNYSSHQIAEYSHEELGYKETSDREIISYRYAEKLRI